MSIIIFLFTALYSIFAWRRLDLALAFLLAVLPIYMIRFSVLGIPSTILELMILICFAVWVIRETQFLNILKRKYKLADIKKNRKKRRPYPFSLEIVGVLVVSFIAVGVAGFADSAFGIWKAYFFEPILVFILILNVFQRKYKFNFNYLILPLASSVFLISVFAIYQKITGDFIFNEFWANAETRRVTSFFAYPNAVGLYLGPIVMILVGWLFCLIKRIPLCHSREGGNSGVSELRLDSRLYPKGTSGWARGNNKVKVVFIFLTILLSLASIYFAKSEGAAVGVAGAMVIFVFLGFKKLRFLFLVLCLVLAFVATTYLPARDYVFEKVALKDVSGEIRKQQWRETWEMLENGKLFFGAGLSRYQEEVSPYHQEGIFFNKDRDPDFRRKIVIFNDKYKAAHWQPVEVYFYPHNFFLNFWTELGILGMLLFSWMVIKFFILAKKIINKENKFLVLGLVGAMLVIFIHGLVDVPYFKNDLAVLFWMILAMLGALKLESETKNK